MQTKKKELLQIPSFFRQDFTSYKMNIVKMLIKGPYTENLLGILKFDKK